MMMDSGLIAPMIGIVTPIGATLIQSVRAPYQLEIANGQTEYIG